MFKISKLPKEVKNLLKNNYFAKEIHNIKELKHFPYDDFSAFVADIRSGKVMLVIAHDYAREWLFAEPEAPKFWQKVAYILALFPFLVAVFYLIITFYLWDFWYLLLIPAGFILVYLGGYPFGATMGINFLMFLSVIIYSLVKGKFLSYYVWLPILLGILAIKFLCKLGVWVIHEEMLNNEELVCYFWRKAGLGLQFANGDNYWQNSKTVNRGMESYKDLYAEWDVYLDTLENHREQIKLHVSSKRKLKELKA